MTPIFQLIKYLLHLPLQAALIAIFFLTKEQALKLSEELKYVIRGIDDPNFKPVEKKFSLSIFGPDSQRWYFYRSTPSGVFVTLDEALATDLREDEIEPAQEVLRKRGYTTFQIWDVVRD